MATVSQRAARLVEQLEDASRALIDVVDQISPERWSHVAIPGEWSAGKDAEHVVEGNGLHQWVVRSTLKQRSGRRPGIERKRLTAGMTQAEVLRLLRQCVAESRGLVEALSDEQLDLPCRTRTVGEFIQKVLIGHMRTHQVAIERKLRRAA